MLASPLFADDAPPASCAPLRPAGTTLVDGFAIAPWREIDFGELRPAWQRLAERAASPNPFFELWLLHPALEHFGSGKVQIATLVVNGELVALLPYFHDRDYHGRLLPHIAAWSHANAFLSVPLVAAGFEHAFWEAFLESVDKSPEIALFLHLDQLPAEDPVTAALFDICCRGRRGASIVRRSERALLVEGPSPKEHLEAALSSKRRKELRRQRRRLEELGEVRFHRVTSPAAVDGWIEAFLDLEALGWKGEAASALACDERTRSFFVESVRQASDLGRFEGLSLELSGRPLAMLANFLTPPGAFSFKTAFDEEYARFSPGVLLQIENLKMLDDPRIAWCDSCAAQDHPMIDRMWPDHRKMIAVTVAIGGPLRRAVGRTLSAIERRRMDSRR